MAAEGMRVERGGECWHCCGREKHWGTVRAKVKKKTCEKDTKKHKRVSRWEVSWRKQNDTNEGGSCGRGWLAKWKGSDIQEEEEAAFPGRQEGQGNERGRERDRRGQTETGKARESSSFRAVGTALVCVSERDGGWGAGRG